MTREEVIDTYIKKFGSKKAKEVLNYLGKEQPFISAISTELGQEIMNLHISRAQNSLDRFISLLPDNEDIAKLNTKTVIALAEYNVCIGIINEVQTRINTFNQYDSI